MLDGEAGVEVELAEKEVVGVDGEEVVWLQRWPGEVTEVEGDDDFSVGANRCGQDVAVFRVVGLMPSMSDSKPVTMASGNE